ncbi:alpha/beta fold hydrolase [Paracoccus cavernae]|uniref:Alpha/beta fold hydrolase n=1 Tax=Paracoccus cavernae TaxID=1571207 RepID=A0ABT8D975_9RHOB|nr:alpha/beta fold hydrolase [Paracoccus cavernae]
MRKYLISFVIILSACAPRGEVRVDPSAATVGEVQEILVGTTRASEGPERSEEVRYGRVDVSVPPQRKVGTIKFPVKDQPANPQTDFLTTQRLSYPTREGFRQAVREQLRNPQVQSDGDAVIFVHGYNNTFAEGLYRFAQFAHDLDMPGTYMHFAWPSRGQTLAYAADRDSVLFSRDGLQQMIEDTQAAGARQVVLVGHSMGTELVMETLRQMAIGGKRKELDKIGGVVLFSPDIDVDVFRMQAKAIGKLPQPFLIFTSSKDSALQLSARLSGEPVRLGSLQDARRVSDLEVMLVDTAAFNTGSGHFDAASSPALLSILTRAGDIGSAFANDAGGRVGLFTGAALTVERAAQVVLLPDQYAADYFRR